MKNRNQLNFLIAHISNEEVPTRKQIAVPLSIPIKLLKRIPDLFLIPLCMIINQSFFTGKYHDALRIYQPIKVEQPVT